MEKAVWEVDIQMVIIKSLFEFIFVTFKVIIVIVALIVGILFFFMYTMPNGGELLYSTSSPSGQYTIDVYFHYNSLGSDSVRCKAYHESGLMERNIYYSYPKETVEIEWISETEVIIDGTVVNIVFDRYDWRWDNE